MQEFNIDYIRHEWEYIKRRIRTVHNGSKIAALLNGCTLLDLDESYTPPLLVIRASAIYQYRNLLPYVEEDVVSWAIEMTMGIPCQVQLLPPLQGILRVSPPRDAGRHGQTPVVTMPPVITEAQTTHVTIETFPMRRQHWSDPLKLEYIQADWPQISKMIYKKDNGGEIAQALADSQPVALHTDSYPPTLVLRALNERARSALAHHAADGSLTVALLNELGHVCRLRILPPPAAPPSP
ncbi:hypothetical protein [Dictyobacter aurantiacus]|uniref:Uncharacterized protein n=1 Tax=Dictyobacter aurantiacus TaxID=1936993 RepID=A0A401ZJG7_9CHLR|nr:hypothetical protein [Dictyobacter aurantiacus]GCE06982.1 hypothetical protein KDAU_43110 [Dictyobacter aurantiacus]